MFYLRSLAFDFVSKIDNHIVMMAIRLKCVIKIIAKYLRFTHLDL